MRGETLFKVPLIFGAALALAVGVWGGLARLGGVIPALESHHTLAHGPLMVGGLLGTLFGLEKAVTIGRWWGYSVPAAVVISTVWLVLSPDQQPAAWLLTTASAGALVVAVVPGRRQADLAARVLVLGALCWLLGNLQWAALGLVILAIAWWMAFVVLTLIAERLELSRLSTPSLQSRGLVVTGLGLFFGGLLLSYADHELGMRLFGVGLITLAIWGLRWDPELLQENSTGHQRFTAVCFLGSYAWLAIAGAMMLIAGSELSGLLWDGALHAFFLGFAFSMLFGRTAGLAQAILGLELTFSPSFYIHVFLLHASLMVRVGADFAGSPAGRSVGAILNMVAIAAFLLATLRVAVAGAFADR